MKKQTKKRIAAAILLGFAAALTIWTVWQNLTVGVTEYTVTSERLPEAFDGFTIAQISDLHNSELSEQTLAHLRELSPDMIAITGDLVDSDHTDIGLGISFAAQAAQIAPCYYVTGNHEAWISRQDAMTLEEGVAAESRVLHDACVMLERDGAEIAVLGVDDPDFVPLTDDVDAVSGLLLPQELQKLAGDAAFTVLLSHRPELFENYVQAGMDVVLSGHAHGGQIRLPFLGGLAAPNQGFLPEYDAGVFRQNETTMIVSRGIGNSIIPVRFNNRPEVVLITLRCE